MTARTFEVPKRVAANIARRHAAQQTALRCVYKCRAHARLYPCGARCDEHAPWAVAGRPDPASQVDPTRTLAALRARLQQPDAEVRAIRAQPEDSLDTRFRAWHEQNSHVYVRVVELVADAVLRGEKRIGVGALFEQLRYSERTETNGDRYRLNNSFRAPLVRLLLEEHPEWSDLFELRERRAS